MRATSMGAWALGLVGAAALGCGSSYGGGSGGMYGGAPAPQCTAATATAVTNGTIGIVAPMSFAPACARIAAGTTVTFSNADSIPHTVTADDGSFDSGAVNPGAQFTHTFASAATVGIHCSIHAGMRMTLFVQ